MLTLWTGRTLLTLWTGGTLLTLRTGGTFAIARSCRIQCIRHAQQLLRAFDGVIGAAIRIGFGFQKIRTVSPVNSGEITIHHRAAANLQRHQAIGIGDRGVRLLINHRAIRTALQDGDSHTHIATNKRVAFIANHRLIGEFLRGLGKKQHPHEKQNDKG